MHCPGAESGCNYCSNSVVVVVKSGCCCRQSVVVCAGDGDAEHPEPCGYDPTHQEQQRREPSRKI